MSMNKNTYPLHLAQANLRRWLDARVPVGGNNVTLSDTDHKKLTEMINKWRIPLIARYERKGNKTITLIVEEKENGNENDFYVLKTNIPCGTFWHTALPYTGFHNFNIKFIG